MGVKILSLYDGMACGMIAMQLAGVEVESYDAYEIDKYAKQTYMSATTKPIFISIDSLSDWQHHSLKMELSSLKMGNIGGVSNSAAYKMLGNGWTCEVIAHIVRSCLLSVNTIGGN